MQTKASNSGVWALLSRKFDGKLFPVVYASKKLLPREKAYSVIEREGFAIVWGVRKFKTYLYGREFVLQTDHQPLTFNNSSKGFKQQGHALGRVPSGLRVPDSIGEGEGTGRRLQSRMYYNCMYYY